MMAGCATTPVVKFGDGHLSDTLQQEEASILELVHPEIQKLETQGALLRDPELEAYLAGIGQRMVPTRRTAESGLVYRFRVVRDPTLNAFAFPTGDIFVHTGLLARLQTEAELADVLGHEASHVYSRDTLFRFMDAKQKTIAWKVTDLVLTPAFAFVGAGGLSELGLGLIYATSVTGYGREQEARADLDGLQQLADAGYDPAQGVAAEYRFLAEEERYRRGLEVFFLASHPDTRWRIAEKERWLKAKGIEPVRSGAADPQYLVVTAKVRKENARLNLQLDRFYHAIDDLQALLDHGGPDAEAWALIGDAYREMSENPRAAEFELSAKAWREFNELEEAALKSKWREQARQAYQQGFTLDCQLPEAHRGMGLLLAAEQRRDEATASLQRYLALRPGAKDRRFITTHLERLSQASGGTS